MYDYGDYTKLNTVVDILRIHLVLVLMVVAAAVEEVDFDIQALVVLEELSHVVVVAVDTVRAVMVDIHIDFVEGEDMPVDLVEVEDMSVDSVEARNPVDFEVVHNLVDSETAGNRVNSAKEDIPVNLVESVT